jgi:hypothetical protein
VGENGVTTSPTGGGTASRLSATEISAHSRIDNANKPGKEEYRGNEWVNENEDGSNECNTTEQRSNVHET